MRGQFQVLTIVIGLVAISLVNILLFHVYMTHLGAVRQLMRLGFTIFVAASLLFAASWARWFTIIATGLGGIGALFSLTKLKMLPLSSKEDIIIFGCWFMFIAIFYLSSSFILLTSSDIESYFK